MTCYKRSPLIDEIKIGNYHTKQEGYHSISLIKTQTYYVQFNRRITIPPTVWTYITIHSVVVTHGHAGQFPGGPTSIGTSC